MLRHEPATVIAEAKRAAEALIAQITSDPDHLVINGEIYPAYEDWQLLGRFFNVSASVVSTKYVEYGDVVGFEASAEALLMVDGRTIRVSAGDGLCLNDEWKWQDKPLFQLKSMAQTRACVKALRNTLAWVVVLAGFKPTPAEEMESEREQHVIAPPRRQSQEQQPPAPRQPERRDPPRHDPPQRPRGERYQQRYDHYHRSPRRDHGRGRGPDGRQISDRQLNRLFAIARDNNIPNSVVRRIVSHYGFADAQDITRDVYEDICDRVFKAGE